MFRGLLVENNYKINHNASLPIRIILWPLHNNRGSLMTIVKTKHKIVSIHVDTHSVILGSQGFLFPPSVGRFFS